MCVICGRSYRNDLLPCCCGLITEPSAALTVKLSCPLSAVTVASSNFVSTCATLMSALWTALLVSSLTGWGCGVGTAADGGAAAVGGTGGGG